MRPILSQFKDEGFSFPDYKNSNMQILKEIAYGNNRRTGSKPKKIFMVIDGLGYNLLSKAVPNLPGYPELSNISTVFPSTTSVVLSSIESGKTPSEHGIIAWQVYMKEIGGITLPFRDSLVLSKNFKLSSAGIPPIIPEPRMLYKIEEKKKMLLQYQESVTRPHDHMLKNTSTNYHASHMDMLVGLKREILLDRYDFIYAYTDVIDHAQHRYGVSSEEVSHWVKTFISDFERILLPAIIRSDYNLVITADHGTIEASNKISVRYDDKIMDYLLMPPYGDPRIRYFHVEPGKEERFERHFNNKYGKYALLLKSDSVIKTGLFGNKSVKDNIRARFGTHIAIMKGHGTFDYGYPVTPPRHGWSTIGHHSGMSEDEMRVPLVVY
jgi:predicted AlkP superfamily pyrophosphatase or phosphodiesterase